MHCNNDNDFNGKKIPWNEVDDDGHGAHMVEVSGMSGGDRELVKPLPAITKLPPHDKTELQKILLETPKNHGIIFFNNKVWIQKMARQ